MPGRGSWGPALCGRRDAQGSTRGALERPRIRAPRRPAETCPLCPRTTASGRRSDGQKEARWWQRPAACAGRGHRPGSVASRVPASWVLWMCSVDSCASGAQGSRAGRGVPSRWAGLVMSEKSCRTARASDPSSL